MRLILAHLAAAGVGTVGALILGEYAFRGPVVLASGVVLGLFVGEAAIAVHGRRAAVLGAVCGAVSAAAMVWAGWISTGHDLSFVGPAGWTAVALAACSGLLRAGVRPGGTRPVSGSRPGEQAPAGPPERPAG